MTGAGVVHAHVAAGAAHETEEVAHGAEAGGATGEGISNLLTKAHRTKVKEKEKTKMVERAKMVVNLQMVAQFR